MDSRSPCTKWYFHLTDFANTLKAFIGCNYLTIGFAFKQSGLVFGIIGTLLIAMLTDHCCHLLVKAKYLAINQQACKPQTEPASPSSSASDDSDDSKTVQIENQTLYTFTYGDIANFAFGKVGLSVVNVCIFITQYGFCVGYFIFIGNTLFNFFPFKNYNVSFTNTSNYSDFVKVDQSIDSFNDSYRNTNLSNFTADSMHQLVEDSIRSKTSNQESKGNVSEVLLNISSTTLPTSPMVSVNQTRLGDTVMMSGTPFKAFLILIPLPIFILFSYFRHIRHFGVISAIANISIFSGCVFVVFFLVIDFSVSNFQYFQLSNVQAILVFFGMVTATYEGIGCVIPIESSMEGNQHNFVKFLHGSIILVTIVILLFGILGYLRFGEGVAQILNMNIPPKSFLSFTVNLSLILGVLFTFPLQVFPVIQMAENYLFGDDRLCGPKEHSILKNDDDDDDDDDTEQTRYHVADRQILLPKNSSSTKNITPSTDSNKLTLWRNNILRTFIVLSAAGLAVIFRNSFAYIAGFIGAVGSTTLAYIMPALIYNKLRGVDLKLHTKIKNCVIVVIGVVCGVASLCAVVIELINSTTV